MTNKDFIITSQQKLEHLEKIKSYIIRIHHLMKIKIKSNPKITYYLTKFFALEGIKNPTQKTYQYSRHNKVDPKIDKRINSLLS